MTIFHNRVGPNLEVEGYPFFARAKNDEKQRRGKRSTWRHQGRYRDSCPPSEQSVLTQGKGFGAGDFGSRKRVARKEERWEAGESQTLDHRCQRLVGLRFCDFIVFLLRSCCALLIDCFLICPHDVPISSLLLFPLLSFYASDATPSLSDCFPIVFLPHSFVFTTTFVLPSPDPQGFLLLSSYVPVLPHAFDFTSLLL